MLAPYPILPHLMHIAMQGVGSTPIQYARTHRSKKRKVQRGRRNRRHYIKSLMGSW